MNTWNRFLTARRRGTAGCALAACLFSTACAAGELQQRLQWDQHLTLRALALEKDAQLLSWHGEYYADRGWSLFGTVQHAARQAVGAYGLGAHYSLPAGDGELQLGWQAQGFTGYEALRRWNYHQLTAAWLTERCALTVGWIFKDSASAALDYKGPTADVGCIQPLPGQFSLEFGLGAVGWDEPGSQHFAHAGLTWRRGALTLRVLRARAGASSRQRYPSQAEPYWNASASWSF